MQAHTFHIPVMGLGFTIDTPIKVAQYGITSVVSIVDDMLIEKMRQVLCNKHELPYTEISAKTEDYRAKRITEYLNLLDTQVKSKFEELKNTIFAKGEELDKYLSMLPDISELKIKLNEVLDQKENLKEIRDWVNDHLSLGEIDVNIMTKLDKKNTSKGEELPVEFNDAHAALRGFANSNLSSSIVLSAGMNPRLYSYFEKFEDFFPDNNFNLKKKIILKVSDYRSALIQGKFLAKKGLWVSEYRVESGLNCGGHAFATDGFLMGPILEEFKQKRDELINSLFPIWTKALETKGFPVSEEPLQIKFTAQGGVGTSEEHEFLLDHYDLDSIGWGTPFLLVDEAATIDEETQELLRKADEKDLYLSDNSPLGVKFNTVAGSSMDVEKVKIAEEGKPGSACPKKYLISNLDYTENPICTASRQFQNKKLGDLETLSEENKNAFWTKVIEKSCLCVGLATSALKANNANDKVDGENSLVCPGPNLAYFNKKATLKEMVDHIYGRVNLIDRNDRPNVFLKELKLYIDYIKEKIDDLDILPNAKEIKYFETFEKNISDGISYYKELFENVKHKFGKIQDNLKPDLEKLEKEFYAALDKIKISAKA